MQVGRLISLVCTLDFGADDSMVAVVLHSLQLQKLDLQE